MKVIQADLATLEALELEWKNLAPDFLGEGFNRQFDENGDLINQYQGKNYNTVTFSKWGILEDSVQGHYMIHPDKKRGVWRDSCLDAMTSLIPVEAIINENFTPTSLA